MSRTTDLEDRRKELQREAEKLERRLEVEFFLPTKRRQLETKLRRLREEAGMIARDLDRETGQGDLFSGGMNDGSGI